MGEWPGAVEGLGQAMIDLNFYNGKRVFITGHTGFKGAWMCRILISAGAAYTAQSVFNGWSKRAYELHSWRCL